MTSTQGLTFCLGDLWSLTRVGISHAFCICTYGTLRLESDGGPSPYCELALGSPWLPQWGLSFSICKVDVLRPHLPFSPSPPLSSGQRVWNSKAKVPLVRWCGLVRNPALRSAGLWKQFETRAQGAEIPSPHSQAEVSLPRGPPPFLSGSSRSRGRNSWALCRAPRPSASEAESRPGAPAVRTAPTHTERVQWPGMSQQRPSLHSQLWSGALTCYTCFNILGS